MSYTFSTFGAMKNTLKMKRIMFSYLDTLYPGIYLLELDRLGDVVETFDKDSQGNWFDDRRVGRSKNSWFDLREEIIRRLELMFSVNYRVADTVVNDWVNCRPKYKYVRKSMDEQVLVPVPTKISDLPIVLKEEWILEPVKEKCHMTL
jgi:hypothetical protein